MTHEKIIEKIANLFDLSNSSNEHEAAAAAAKAQELLAKYNIEMAELEGKDFDEEITEMSVDTGAGNKWRMLLSRAVANNFRCEVYHRVGGRHNYVVFLGHKTDCLIARNTFEFLFKTGNLLAQRQYTKYRNDNRYTHGVKNTYLYGYVQGIKSVLDRQCTALMIITPQDVKDEFAERVKGCKKSPTRLFVRSLDSKAYSDGYSDGREVMDARSITG